MKLQLKFINEKKIKNVREYLQIRKAIAKYLHPLKLNGSIDDLSNKYHNTFYVDFDTTAAKKQNRDFAGMQIVYEDGIYEVSEYMAGKDQNELHIFGEYKTINAALKRLLKGKNTPIKIWD